MNAENMKTNLILILFFFSLLSSRPLLAQHIRPGDLKELDIRQDSLSRFADDIVNAQEAEQRFRSDSTFIRMLVRALKVPGSFYFPFDSLETISKLYPPDSSFRIFTWQVKKDEFIYMQRGAIQMRTADGSLKLFGLHDVSMFTPNPNDSVRSPSNWIGAIYYRIIEKKWNEKNIYTLLGFDDFNIGSNKKWMEILTFNEQGLPVFGGPYFSFRDDSIKSKKVPARFNIEYKKEAVTTFNYDTSMDMIIYDHLISETDEPVRKETYIPDGDYEGFKWVNGQWLHVDKVFTFTLQNGQFPQDQKILNDAGGLNEDLLNQQTEKNKKKKKP
jgi:hypothetical protein